MILNSERSKCILFLLLLLLLVLATTTNAACNDEQWECDNGDCVNFDERCDGTVDCLDKSDEVARNCIHKQCPAYAFRCAYGACVRHDAKCDGHVDCADKSDELPRICGDAKEFELQSRGACSELQMECYSGSCIDVARKCDGIVDCSNGADETVEVCGLRKCASYAFQCGYGACLYAGVFCNSTSECLDGSDESYELCGYKRITNYILDDEEAGRAKSRDRISTTTQRVVVTKLPPTGNSSWCGLPTDYPHLIISDLAGKPLPGAIKKGTFVRYSCSDGYKLVNGDIQTSYCEGPNFHRITECEKPCNTSVINRDFTKSAKCRLDSYSYDCVEANSARPGTEVFIQCATYFYPTTRTALITSQQCTEAGEWSEDVQQCTMHCGTTVQTHPLAANALDVSNSEIPWHVGIYTSVNERTFNYTCGGTIISPLLVLTAAHCVFDVVNGTARPAYSFQIIASKFYKDYYHTESGSQIRNVSKIIVHNDYKHFDVFQNDLALFVLDRHLKFGRTVRPICIDRPVEESVSAGKLGAWGMSENARYNKYEVLQVVSAQHYAYDRCKEMKRNEVLTPDKLCLRSILGLACRGDSGGGYFIYNPNTEMYYLKGVLSSASATDTVGCANSDTLLYVIDVYQFRNWINKWRLIEENHYISATSNVKASIAADMIVETLPSSIVTQPTKEIPTTKMTYIRTTTKRAQIRARNRDFVFPQSEED